MDVITDEQVQKFYDLIQAEKKFISSLWQMSYEIKSTLGMKGLIDLSEKSKETFGETMSPSTLRQYAWVHQKTKDLGLPEDLSFNIVRAIATIPDPVTLAQRIRDETLNSAEIWKIILKQKPKKIKVVKCPSCGKEWQLAKK